MVTCLTHPFFLCPMGERWMQMWLLIIFTKKCSASKLSVLYIQNFDLIPEVSFVGNVKYMGPAEDMERTTVPHRMYVSFNIILYALDVNSALFTFSRNEIKFMKMKIIQL